MKKSILAVFAVFIGLVFSGCSKYEVSPNKVNLNASFVDNKWDGTKVPSDEVCSNFNKKVGSTPAIKITNIPAGTTKIILSFNDLTYTKMAGGGHGVISYDVSNQGPSIVIPSMLGETFNLPKNFKSEKAHRGNRGDKGAYLAPCSGGKGNTYTVDIEAINDTNKEKPILMGETNLRLGKF